jgi:hypothetical protein
MANLLYPCEEAESPSYSGPSQNEESSSYQVTHPEEDDVEETDQDRQEQANTDQEESNEDKGVETEESIRKKEMDDLSKLSHFFPPR